MTDKELVQQRIDELTTAISEGRHTGRTYRAINQCIQELFEKPIGSQIALVDNPKSEDNTALKKFVDMFSNRMIRDFPDTYFKIQYPSPGVAIVVRTNETYTEIAKKRISQWKKKLEEMD